MLVTFGATFFGVIASFLLWFGGHWWLKRYQEHRAVKHMEREIHEEIALNINILASFTESVPRMIDEGNVPLFLPHRMNLSVYRYLTSSGELRLLDVSKQRWILNAGMYSESFNKFVDNTELLLTSLLGLPNSLKVAIQRLEMLVEQAQETAKNLNKILEKLDVSKANNEEAKRTNSDKESVHNVQEQRMNLLRQFVRKHSLLTFAVVAVLPIGTLLYLAISFASHSIINSLLALGFFFDSLAAGVALYVALLDATRRWYILAIEFFIFGMFFKLFGLL